MSRADQQRRRKRRKERRAARNHSSFPRFDGEFSDEDVVTISECVITDEPLHVAEDRDEQFDKAVEGIQEDLHEQIHTDPAGAVVVMEPLLERFPESCLLLNWLAAAYEATGRKEAAVGLIRRNYELHPGYLFARVSYCLLMMEEDRLDEVDRVIGGKWDLKSMYPHRDRFHITEFVAFSVMVFQYMIRRQRFECAMTIFESMCEIAPDHPATKGLRCMMEGSLLTSMARMLMESWRK
jgi:hypothetical protein